jgi:hypothetical protein
MQRDHKKRSRCGKVTRLSGGEILGLESIGIATAPLNMPFPWNFLLAITTTWLTEISYFITSF